MSILVIAGLRSRQGEINAKLMVTTSNRVSVNRTDFGDGVEIEGDVLAVKRSHEDDDASSGESDGTSGTSASTESDADVVPEKRRRRGAHHKPRHHQRRESNCVHSAESGFAFRVEEAAAGGYTRFSCLRS